MCEQISAMLKSKLPKLACGRGAALTLHKALVGAPAPPVPPGCQEDSQFQWKLLNSGRLPFSANARDREGFRNHITFL